MERKNVRRWKSIFLMTDLYKKILALLQGEKAGDEIELATQAWQAYALPAELLPRKPFFINRHFTKGSFAYSGIFRDIKVKSEEQ